MLITRMIRNRTARDQLFDGVGADALNMATSHTCSYKMDPTTTLLVTRKNVTFLNRLVPMITLARPDYRTGSDRDFKASLLLCIFKYDVYRPLADRPTIFTSLFVHAEAGNDGIIVTTALAKLTWCSCTSLTEIFCYHGIQENNDHIFEIYQKACTLFIVVENIIYQK